MAETHPQFDVSVVTPDGSAYEGPAEMLVVPGAAGEIGVLARHAPLIATLKAGSTRVYLDRAAEEVIEFATGPGFFKVELDRALALVDDAVNVKEIDDARAQQRFRTRRPLARVGPASRRPTAGSSSASSTPRTSWRLRRDRRLCRAEPGPLPPAAVARGSPGLARTILRPRTAIGSSAAPGDRENSIHLARWRRSLL